jgi:hypothetical protein
VERRHHCAPEVAIVQSARSDCKPSGELSRVERGPVTGPREDVDLERRARRESDVRLSKKLDAA